MSANIVLILPFRSESRRPDPEEEQEPSAGSSSAGRRRHAELVVVRLQPEQLQLGRRRGELQLLLSVCQLLVPCQRLAAAVAGVRVHTASRSDGGSAAARNVLAGDQRAAAVMRQLLVGG
jgi:hypothetical protein